MRRLLPLLFLLLVPFVLADEASPFVRGSTLVSVIVVGDDAPPTDVILGVDVVSYLGQFADYAAPGLSKTSSQVDLDDAGVYILIGTPENNPLVAEVLGGVSPKGPYLSLDGDIMVISGRTDGDVQTAVELFRSGQRDYGSLEGSLPANGGEEPEEEPETEPTSTYRPWEKPSTATETGDDGSDDLVEPADGDCLPELFCSGNVLKQRRSDCTVKSVEYCSDGCEAGKCKTSFFSKIIDLLFGWLSF